MVAGLELAMDILRRRRKNRTSDFYDYRWQANLPQDRQQVLQEQFWPRPKSN